MEDVKKFIMEASQREIWKEVRKRISCTKHDRKHIRYDIMAWLVRRDRRRRYYRHLIKILED